MAMKPWRRLAWMLPFLWLLTSCAGSDVRRPGTLPDGSVLLPNHWRLTPAGEQIAVGDLPLAMAVAPDGRHLLVANNGYADQYVSVVDLKRGEEVQRLPMDRSWLGLAFDGSDGTSGRRFFVSGGGGERIDMFRFAGGRAVPQGTITVAPPEGETAEEEGAVSFVAGLAVAGDRVLACLLRRHQLAVLDPEGHRAPRYVDVGAFPYEVAADPDRGVAYVSNWGGESVSVVDLAAGDEVARVGVGDHPNALALSADGRRLYVTNASSNDLFVIDTERRVVLERVDLSPYAGAPSSGSTPNGLALSADGRTAYVANADNNSVGVVDLAARPPRVAGHIPVGWYPTAVTVTGDGRLLVANGKGLSSKANPGGPLPYAQDASQYIGRLFPGTVSVIPLPDEAGLARYTAAVNANNGFDDMDGRLAPGRAGVAPRAIPRRVGEPSLIEHVFYIIRENRTYDQVLGDLPQGEGDPSLTLFGRDNTPNAHALAETFVLFDNLYVDAEVSADGHAWSMGAIATDAVEKLWPTNYSDRGFPFPLGIVELAYPHLGYLWDAAERGGVSYRSFGEFVVAGPDGPTTSMPTLKGHYDPSYPGLDLTVTDTRRAEIFERSLAALVDAEAVPQLNVIYLPRDHTLGTRPGALTPRSMVAENDLALGRVIQAIAASPVWPKSAVFVIEDDSQNGPDHVDSHRTVALVASPYARRGYVDHTMYDTVSLLRTMELILGLPPMSQYDAAAVPLHAAFTDTPDLTPYRARPNRLPLDETNAPDAVGAELSARMNFAQLDAAPELLLNDIIWKSVRGADAVMPRPHSTRPDIGVDDDDEDDEAD